MTVGIPGSRLQSGEYRCSETDPVPPGRMTSWVFERSRKKSVADQIRLVELLEYGPSDASRGGGGRFITARICSQICQNPTIYPHLCIPRQGKMPPRAV